MRYLLKSDNVLRAGVKGEGRGAAAFRLLFPKTIRNSVFWSFFGDFCGASGYFFCFASPKLAEVPSPIFVWRRTWMSFDSTSRVICLFYAFKITAVRVRAKTLLECCRARQTSSTRRYHSRICVFIPGAQSSHWWHDKLVTHGASRHKVSTEVRIAFSSTSHITSIMSRRNLRWLLTAIKSCLSKSSLTDFKRV